MTWRRPPKPLALDQFYFGEPSADPESQPHDSSFDRFLTFLMWVSLIVLAFIAMCAAVVLQALYL